MFGVLGREKGCEGIEEGVKGMRGGVGGIWGGDRIDGIEEEDGEDG